MNSHSIETEVTLVEPSSEHKDNEKEEDDSVETELILRVVSEGGYYNATKDLTGEQVGEMFQNPIATNDDGTASTNNNNTASSVRVGTNQICGMPTCRNLTGIEIYYEWWWC